MYGYSLDSLHSDAAQMTRNLAIAKSQFQSSRSGRGERGVEQDVIPDKERAIWMDHINCRLSTGKYYQLKDQSGSYLALQIVCKHPERRSYVQRVCFMGKDEP